LFAVISFVSALIVVTVDSCGMSLSLDPGLSRWIQPMFVDNDCVLWEDENEEEEDVDDERMMLSLKR
jgi:hypothetical protein